MITVKSKNQFGEEILVNTSKIIYVIPSSGGIESTIFFDNDVHLTILEPFDEFKKRFDKVALKAADILKDITPCSTNESKTRVYDYPDHLPRLPTGNVDKRTVQYKEWIESKGEHHPV